MKCSGQAQLQPHEAEKVRPKSAGEDWIPIANDGAGDAMEAHNVVKEGACNGDCPLEVAQSDGVHTWRSRR